MGPKTNIVTSTVLGAVLASFWWIFRGLREVHQRPPQCLHSMGRANPCIPLRFSLSEGTLAHYWHVRAMNGD
ncbi:hypothetical protein BC827DRAFT_1251004, partial [Russula dissimulans]